MKVLAKLLKATFALAGFGSRRKARLPGAADKPRRRGFVRNAVVFAGSAAMVLGASLVAVGLYGYFTDDEPSVESAPAALSHRFDPGGIYDRPVGLIEPTPTPAPTSAPASPTPTAAPAVAAAPPPPLRDQPYNIVIEKIGVNAGVFTYGLDANQVPEVPYNGWDVAWYNFSAAPGTGNNAVFAAHVTWDGPAVFYNLDALVAGDEIRLTGVDGTTVRYRVTESFLVDPEDPEAIQVMLGTDKDVITLITCGGSPYYVGGSAGYDYTHRLVVRGELIGVQNA